MFTILDQFPKLNYFIADVHNGSSAGTYATNNLALHTGDDEASVLKNREALCESLNIKTSKLYIPEQTHSSNIKVITNKELDLSQTDALITQEKDIAISILTADCVPVIIYNAKQHVAGVVHAGWKGIVNDIVSNTIDLMQSRFGGKTSNYYAAIGPCIGTKKYEVGEEVAEKFDAIFPKQYSVVNRTISEKPHIDLALAVRLQLIQAGIPQMQIEASGECTFQNENYFSARRQGLKSGRFASGVVLR